MIAGNFILLNLFISVINEGLAFLRENPDKAEYDLELADYITVWSNQNNTHVYRIGIIVIVIVFTSNFHFAMPWYFTDR